MTIRQCGCVGRLLTCVQSDLDVLFRTVSGHTQRSEKPRVDAFDNFRNGLNVEARCFLLREKKGKGTFFLFFFNFVLLSFFLS